MASPPQEHTSSSTSSSSPHVHASVWDVLAASKVRRSELESQAETQRSSMRLRKDAIAVLNAEFQQAAKAGKTRGADVLRTVTDPARRHDAVQAMLDEHRTKTATATASDDAHANEWKEIYNLQQKAVAELQRAQTILAGIADEQELASSRAGRLEYKVRA